MNGTTEESEAVFSDGRWFVYVRQTRCPVCHKPNIKTQATKPNGDGTRTRQVKCKDCGENFTVVVE